MVAVSNGAGRVESESITLKVVQPASIVSQPEGGSAVLGETFVMSVVTVGTEPISYQWHFGGQAMEGATKSSLSLANVKVVNSGDYHVVVSNHARTVSSDTVTLSVESPPVITELAESLSAVEGESVELSVTAVGTVPITYQWSKGGVALAGATGSTLSLTNVAPSDAADYMVAVSNGAGRVESNLIALNVIQPVAIVSQPAAAVTAIGDKAVFGVSVTGSLPISYQWEFNGEPLANQSAAKLVIENVSHVDGGTYTVTATNASNSVESEGVELTILTPPIITEIVGNQQIAVGETVNLWLTAVGTVPLVYQWKLEGVVISDGTGESIELTGVKSLDAGQYTVEISNSAGSIVSDPIEVSVVAAPQIVSQPTLKNIGLNARLILTVSATGSGLAYQWYRDNQAITGGTDAVLTVPNAGASDAGSYHVTVTNTVGSVTSEAAEVVVVVAPDILTQPEGGFASLGDEFVLSVEAKGSGDVTYQWRVDGVVLEGETKNVLRLSDLKLSDAGAYAVEVVNEAGITMSDEAEVQVLILVSLIEHPQNQSVVAGSLVLFEAVMSGSNPIAYQWYFNGSPIEGAVEASVRLENLRTENQGDYYVVASNSVSTVTSEVGTLVVNLPPAVASHPTAGTMLNGDDTTFVVEVTGTGPFTYKWQRDGVDIAGATEPTLILADVGAGDDALYTVLVENPYGIIVSDPAKLDVTLAVSITAQPADTHVALDGTLSLSVTATGTGPFEYQWYRGDEKIEGAVESEMQVTNMTRLDDGFYRVQVKNMLGAMFSRKAAVVVDEPVLIVAQPIGATLLQGEDAVMWVLAMGSKPLSYQWQKDGVALEGQTETSLTLSNAVEADGGAYTVIITNSVGFEVSAEALVMVNSPPTIEPFDPVVVSAGDTLKIQVMADDDGDLSKLRYVLRNQPEGMTISASGLIEWTLGSEAEAKTHKVNIVVVDQSLLAVSGKLVVRVNEAPKWLELEEQTVKAGSELVFKPIITDSDDTEWSFTTGNLPEGAAYNSDEGFLWTPGLALVGAHDVKFIATDPHGASGTLTVRINVTANVALTITALEPVVVSRGGKLSVQVIADDPDGDNAKLKYQLQNAPAEMTISAKGLIEWTTTPESEGGTVEVTVLVLNELESRANGVLTVTVNLPPAMVGIGPQTVEAGQVLAVNLSATDPNDTELVYTATELPVGAVFSPETGFRWTPAEDQFGVHEVTFVVTDPHGAQSSEAVTITVTEAPKEPALTLLSSATVLGEYTEESEVALNEDNKTFTVKISGAMRFYKLRSIRETKLKVTSLRLQGDNAVIAYEITGE